MAGERTINPNGATAKTTSPALARNPLRRKWGIQNAGINVLSVTFGNTTVQLSACSVQDDGTGGILDDMEWDGAVTVDGTDMRYNVWEFLY